MKKVGIQEVITNLEDNISALHSRVQKLESGFFEVRAQVETRDEIIKAMEKDMENLRMGIRESR